MIRSLRVLVCIAVLASCAMAQTTLNGAGATFPYPIYSKWFNEYHNEHSNIQINYQSIGSGGGIGRPAVVISAELDAIHTPSDIAGGVLLATSAWLATYAANRRWGPVIERRLAFLPPAGRTPPASRTPPPVSRRAPV